MYGGDDIRITVYSMEGWPKEKTQKKKLRNLCNNTLNSCNQDQELDLNT